ncbi:HAMP domain-containing sensor histidine kinase [Streptomyces sp. NPDC047049]|uniref:sensor histidine kinase n=1 Tax=Streptomyces sp. NPDC047049 TaxID=3156688 RepID=UPI0033D1CAE8
MRARHRGLSHVMGIRGRVALAIALVVTLAVCVFGLLIARPLAVVREAHAREHQQELLASALKSYQRDGTLAPGASLDDGSLPDALTAAARRGSTGTYISSGSAPRVYAATGVSGKVLSIPAASLEQDTPPLATDRALVPLGLSAIALGTVLVWFTAHSLTRRVRLGAVAARRIVSGPPAGPASRPRAGGDEVGVLSQALRHLASSLERRKAEDRELATGVAHELRTPVTGLVAASDLLPHPRGVEMVRAGVQRMSSLVEELDELSRLDAGTERLHREPVHLASAVRGVVARIPDPGDRRTVSVTVVGEGRRVVTDPRRVQRILAIVLDNAVKHGRAPVEVTVAGTRIVVRDHGPGFPQELLQDGPRRFRTGASDRGTGRGLGLSIAVGHALLLGARLRLGVAAGSGAEVVIELAEGRVK